MIITTEVKPELDKTTMGYGVAAVVAIVFNTLLTILKEIYPPLLTYMKDVSILGVKHHWLVHGLIIVVLFYIVGWFLSKKQSLKTMSSGFFIKLIAWATILGMLGILVFFLIELF